MENLTNKQIKDELNGLYRQIYVTECFSVNDIVRYELLLKEAENKILKTAQDLIDSENNILEIN